MKLLKINMIFMKSEIIKLH